MYSLRIKKSINLHLCTKFHLVICLLGWAIKCSVGCVSTSVWLTRYIRAFYLLPMQNLTLVLPWDVFAFKKIHTVWVYRWVVRKLIFVICRVWFHVRVRVTWIWTDAEQIFFFFILIPKPNCGNWYIILKFQIYILCTVPKHPWSH